MFHFCILDKTCFIFNAKNGNSMASLFGEMTARTQVHEIPDQSCEVKEGKVDWVMSFFFTNMSF